MPIHPKPPDGLITNRIPFTFIHQIELFCTDAESFHFLLPIPTDLLPTSDRFTDANVTSFSRLLFDVARDQVIVGAR